MTDLLSGPVPRLESGVKGLDTILGGGFPRANMYIVMGPPGAGKTVLINQICFARARHGEKAVYVTVLAESHGMLLQHLRGFSFFDAALVSDALVYYSGYAVLDEKGLAGLLERVHEILRGEKPELLVFDGMATVEAYADTDLDFKRFVHELQQVTTSYGCTTFLLTHAPGEAGAHAEYTMVDGILELYASTVGVRGVREVQAHKVRGTHHLGGRHFFEITDEGLVVYPRTEALYSRFEIDDFDAGNRKALGIEALDAMLDGGVLARSATVVLGNSGSGKTLLGLNFLAGGLARGEVGLYCGFGEPPVELVAKADETGLDFSSHVDSGRLTILWQPPLEVILDTVAARILETVDAHSVQRLFIDGMEGLAQVAVYPERLTRFITALTSELRARGVTVLLSAETRSRSFSEGGLLPRELAIVAGTVIKLRQIEVGAESYRLVNVAKRRHGAHDASIHTFTISSDRGVHVAATNKAAARILSGRDGIAAAGGLSAEAPEQGGASRKP